MTPYGVLPLVRILVLLENELLINLNTKTGNSGHLNSAVNELKVFLVKSIVKNALTNVVVDTDRLLLNNCVIAGSVKVKTSRKRDGSERTVRSNCNVVCLCHRSDLLNLSKSACMREVGLNDINTARLKQTLELTLIRQMFLL